MKPISPQERFDYVMDELERIAKRPRIKPRKPLRKYRRWPRKAQ